MIRICQILCMVLIFSNVICQNTIANSLAVKWESAKFLFYDFRDLKKLDFLTKNLPSETISGWNGDVKGGSIAAVDTDTWLVKYYDWGRVQHDR